MTRRHRRDTLSVFDPPAECVPLATRRDPDWRAVPVAAILGHLYVARELARGVLALGLTPELAHRIERAIELLGGSR